jgi:hypothetical protein
MPKELEPDVLEEEILDPVEEDEEPPETDPLEDEPSDGQEEDIFIVSYETDKGQRVEENYTAKELSDLIYTAKRGNPEIDDFVKEVGPILNAFQGSKLVQDVAGYRAAGYSDEQIMRHMYQIVQQAIKSDTPPPQEGAPQYDNLEQEIDARLEGKIAEKLTPLIEKMQMKEMEMLKEKVDKRNSSLVNKALEKRGLSMDDLTEQDKANLVDTFYALWPQANWYFTELTAKQANVLINDALRTRSRNKSKIKGSMAPNTLPASGTVNVSRFQGQRSVKRPKDGTTIEQRAKNMKDLLG